MRVPVFESHEWILAFIQIMIGQPDIYTDKTYINDRRTYYTFSTFLVIRRETSFNVEIIYRSFI